MRTIAAVSLFSIAPIVLPAQSAEEPRFEVASIRPVTAPARPNGSMTGGPGSGDPERVAFSGVPMIRLLMLAFGILAPNSGELSGPPWIGSEWYDINAKVPSGATQKQVNLMLRNLLAERFGLKTHRELRGVSGYELTVGKNGPKLRFTSDPTAAPAAATGTPPKRAFDQDGFPAVPQGLSATQFATVDNGNMRVTGNSQSISDLMQAVILTSLNDGKPVVDKTGLTGKYAFKMDLALDGGFRRPNGPPLTPEDTPGPDIFSALDKYLGLKLQKAQILVDALVIDRLDKVPTAN